MSNNQSETPETDANEFLATYNCAGNIERELVVSSVVSRRLEREMRVARKVAEELRMIADQMHRRLPWEQDSIKQNNEQQ